MIRKYLGRSQRLMDSPSHPQTGW